mgnify:CR=1 FL=1
MDIKFNSDHITQATRIGDDLHYKCSECDYHRVMNIKTLETEVLVHGDPVTHSGAWVNPLFDIQTTQS